MMSKYIFHPNQFKDLRHDYDLIIVGSGSTGLVAALQAHELGLKPVIFEKMPKLGGNSTCASSGMNAAETDVQLRHHIVDTYEDFYRDTYIGGGKENNRDLLQYFTSHAALAIDWLDQRGIKLPNLTISGGMHMPRTHRPGNNAPIGAFLIKNLLKLCDQASIPIFNHAHVTRILTNGPRVFGVTVNFKGQKDVHVNSNVVILATGGFGAGKSIIKKYRPDLLHYRTTNQPGATGDGLKLGANVGAGLVDMTKIQIHPTVQQDTSHAYLIPEAIRGEGAILINQQGQRFTNELDTRLKVTAAINKLPEKKAYVVFDQGIRNQIKAIDFYDSIGLVIHGTDLNDLAHHMNVSPSNFTSTIKVWNQMVSKHKDNQFGRTTGMSRPINQTPYYAIHVGPAVHYTMGGLKVNRFTQVLTSADKPIAGLFAAGEVAGGLHGNNRLGGNSIAETVIFGRKAGQSAFQYLQKLNNK
ncbi:flavocytochrome c [Acetilactobacillus jinshanensis]